MEEQTRILQLLQEGRITVDQPEILLAALRAPDAGTGPREAAPGTHR
jgi:hypothetical protein